MNKLLTSFLIVSLILIPFKSFAADDKALVEKVNKAVALLYSQDESGSMKMLCTATIFEKSSKGYLFVSAAHCVGNDDVQKEHSAKSDHPFYITFDEIKTAKKFYPASVQWGGYQHRGEDFSVYEVVTDENWPVIPVVSEKGLKDGAEILNIASPLGLGKQVFHGTISSLYLDRPVVAGDINWKGSVVLQLPGVNGGSSGSAIISEENKSIVAFLVGTIGGSTIIAIPASRFLAVKKAIEGKKYKWYAPEIELTPEGSESN
jgi:S1-C subfamily serine protease